MAGIKADRDLRRQTLVARHTRQDVLVTYAVYGFAYLLAQLRQDDRRPKNHDRPAGSGFKTSSSVTPAFSGLG
jgi:hypothetical protein